MIYQTETDLSEIRQTEDKFHHIEALQSGAETDGVRGVMGTETLRHVETQEPAGQEADPVVDEAETPVVDTPIVDETVDPVIEEPAAETPVSEEPATEEPAVVPGNFNEGLRAEYFALDGRVSSLANIDFDRTPDATGTVADLDTYKSYDPFWADGPESNFAARYTGGFEVQQAGSYTFHLTSDDGSRLSIDGQDVIGNDGLHPSRTESVTLDLDAGFHDLGVLYFEASGAQTLRLEWQGPDTDGVRGVMGVETLRHSEAQEPAGAGSDPVGDGVEAPVTETPATEEPAVEQPAPEEPVVKEAENPVAEAPVVEEPVQHPVLDPNEVAEAYSGRVTTFSPTGGNIASVEILERPDHGHLSVNPDGSLALVMTDSDYVGNLSATYAITRTDGTIETQEATITVTEGPQQSGWGTGASHYMLATDENDNVIVEHGENHRKVYISGDGLTTADIAALEGISEDSVTSWWLRDHSEYGASEDMALATSPGMGLWYRINDRGDANSNWLLLERGHEYDAGRLLPRGTSGESELNPLYVTSWGEGSAPVMLSSPKIYQNNVKNIVVQGLDFKAGALVLGQHENVIFDNVTLSGGETNMSGFNGTMSGITVRNSRVLDVWDEEPEHVTSGGEWSPHASRASGFYSSSVDGLLMEGMVIDHNGFAPDFDAEGSIEGGHPPSMYSHNVYIQASTDDVTFRDSVDMRGASFGAQFRGGVFLEDNMFLDNNIAWNTLGGDYKGAGPVGNYSLMVGNVVTSAAARGADAPRIGALDWGIRNEGLMSTLVDNIVAHANDPDDASDTVSGWSALYHGKGEDSVYADDTIIWRWGNENANTNGLDQAQLNETTIQRYTAELLGLETATIQDLADHLRGLDGTEQKAAVQDMLSYFRVGFGVEDLSRDAAETLRFIPDETGDGVRWDNRMNWDSGDLPGTVAGDNVDLGGNKVVYGGTSVVNDLEFGKAGGLSLTHGRLTVEGQLTTDADNTLDIARAGQFWTNGAAGNGTLDVDVDGGRFVNTGAFRSPVDFTAQNGQSVLATGGATFSVAEGSRLEIVGDNAKVGFDGNDGAAAILDFQERGTLSFTARDGEVGTIGEFRTGAFGEATDVMSGVDLGGAALELDLTDVALVESVRLVTVDELIGSFSSIDILGLNTRDAEIVVDYEADVVWLTLREGDGAIQLVEIGREDDVSTGYEALVSTMLEMQIGENEEQPQVPEAPAEVPAEPEAPEAPAQPEPQEPEAPEQPQPEPQEPAVPEAPEQPQVPQPRGVMEFGWANLNHNAITIDFDGEYENPVVFASIRTMNGNQPAVVRIDETDSDSMTMRLYEPENMDNWHKIETVDYVVVEAGQWELSDGTRISAGLEKVSTIEKDGVVRFDHGLEEADAVFGQHQAGDAPFWTTARIGEDDQGWHARLQVGEGLRSALSDVEISEDIGWIAFDAGDGGSADAKNFRFGTVSGVDDDVDHFDFTASEEPLTEVEGFLHGLSSLNGGDSAFSRGIGMDADGAEFFIQEETTGDRETWHIDEDVSWLSYVDQGQIYGLEIV
ncbi:Beta antigen [Jannaschia seosinensis]|uniref:Beta antigen n=2 Tax=Jannaschia seosinensis TaxID=313367 RepID=A0A0M7B6B0_9RHOB|nr:Beta antigen [Jannaschia seosinensis]